MDQKAQYRIKKELKINKGFLEKSNTGIIRRGNGLDISKVICKNLAISLVLETKGPKSNLGSNFETARSVIKSPRSCMLPVYASTNIGSTVLSPIKARPKKNKDPSIVIWIKFLLLNFLSIIVYSPSGA